jgi:Uma2 family endonuclease
MAQTKLAGTWTYEDNSALPDNGWRYEIIEGGLYEMPSPGSAPPFVIAPLIRLLIPLVENLGGRWCTAPVDVFIPVVAPMQPDILVILPGGPAQVVPRGIEGAPDLLIEVLNPSNRGHDLLTKRSLYARAGVREYWLVDPDARTIEILTLDRDVFHLAAAAPGIETLRSPLLGPLPARANELFVGIDS